MLKKKISSFCIGSFHDPRTFALLLIVAESILIRYVHTLLNKSLFIPLEVVFPYEVAHPRGRASVLKKAKLSSTGLRRLKQIMRMSLQESVSVETECRLNIVTEAIPVSEERRSIPVPPSSLHPALYQSNEGIGPWPKTRINWR